MSTPAGDLPPGEPLGSQERAELEHLRAEVHTLRQRQTRPPGRFWRSVLATVLIVLGSLLAPLAVTAVWLKSEVTDTDRYVATVAPLARDPALQRAVTDRITTEVFTRIDIAGLTNQAADALARQGLPATVAGALHSAARPIANGVQGWVHDQIGRLVSSDEFARAWSEANRTAHTQLVAALTGEQNGGVVIRGDTVSVQLATFINAVKQRLVAQGFTLAEKVPAVNAEFVILQSADVGKVQRGFRLLNGLGTWLPILALALLIGGVLAAPGKRRAVIGAALGVTLGMVLLGAALALARPLYLRSVPADVLPSDAASVIFDQLVVYLRTALRAVLALALIVLTAAWLSGPSSAAVATRRAVTGGIGRTGRGLARLGLRTGPVGAWVYRHRRGLEAGTVAIAAAVLVLWNYPTPATVGTIAAVAVLVVVLIELIGASMGPRARAGV
jgi:hypothetical protein